jgi:hypothetical protein
MKTVTMDFNEYEELKRVQTEIESNKQWVIYPIKLDGSITKYYISTKDEEIKNLLLDIKRNNDDIDKILFELERIKNRTFIQRIFNR